jgi:hypothetical protein
MGWEILMAFESQRKRCEEIIMRVDRLAAGTGRGAEGEIIRESFKLRQLANCW